MMNTCSNTNADSDKIQKLKRLVEKMNQIAYVGMLTDGKTRRSHVRWV